MSALKPSSVQRLCGGPSPGLRPTSRARSGGGLSLTRRSIVWLCLAIPVFAPLSSAAAAGPASLILAASAVGQGQTGTIKGRLVWGDEKIPEIKELVSKGQSDTKDSEVCATSPIKSRELVVDPKTKGVSYGMAYLVKPKGDRTEQVKALLAKSPEVVVDQKNCEFVPYVLPFHKEQKLVFKSSDPVGHNVHITGFNNTGVNTMMAPNTKLPIPDLVAESRPIKLQCDIHSWMTGYLLILDHPFFATTAADGSFEIKDVPAGAQNLIVWHHTGYANPGYGKGMPVTVKAGEATDVGEIKIDQAGRVK
jgi:hypothetical protein